jgi:L-asparaginase II
MADGGDAQNDRLAIVQSLHLGDAEVERVAQAVLDRADHLAFVLQGVRLSKEQSYR